ncbi:hypothetical protein DFR74_10224 [Nocardia puris]|uniref:Uncharacterized protein n=1 Tax=Nocardia puris TaxID=208602 RepID=A0A366DWR7_9NOCA|nr:hypothetical protein DFR74_10224 [Nocardia puris]
MEYEMWFFGNVRVEHDPDIPPDADRPYSQYRFTIDGPPIAHAVAAGTGKAVCGNADRILPHGRSWADAIPDGNVRCPDCLRAHPV